MILAVEEHPRDVKRRLARFGMRPEDPIYVHTGRLDRSKATMAALREFIKEKQIKLVVLDTLSLYWETPDENDNAQVVLRVAPLLELARETGAVVLLVHHERKNREGGQDGQTIRGGSALFALVDQALFLDRRQGGKGSERSLRTLGRYDETPRELILELVRDEYHGVGTPEELGLETIKKKLWGVLSNEPQDVPTLTTKAGVKEKQARKALEALGDQVTQEGDGVKGDPHTYRRATPNSIPSQPHPIGEGTNTGTKGTAAIFEVWTCSICGEIHFPAQLDPGFTRADWDRIMHTDV